MIRKYVHLRWTSGARESLTLLATNSSLATPCQKLLQHLSCRLAAGWAPRPHCRISHSENYEQNYEATEQYGYGS